MNISIISTYKNEISKDEFASKKISRVLLEEAEINLKSPETRHFISEEGMERVRKKLLMKQ